MIIILTSTLIFSKAALADEGLPMAATQLPILWLAFIPIVGIEFWALHNRLPWVPKCQLLKATFWANLASILAGALILIGRIALFTWMLFASGPAWTRKVLQFVLGPLTETTPVDLAAALFSILLWWSILFGTSYWIENLITRKILKSEKLPAVNIKKAAFRANLHSYTFLLLLNFICILYLFK